MLILIDIRHDLISVFEIEGMSIKVLIRFGREN